MNIVDRKTMQEIDRITIEEIKIPSMVLMERAALKVYEHVMDISESDDKMLAICGYGNNGGDGIAVARMLYLAGRKISIYMLGDQAKATKQVIAQLQIVQNLGLEVISKYDINEYNIIIDAIFGVGISREIKGKYREVIEAMNESEAKVVAVDVPSGINADDGSILGIAVKADITITFGYMKIGLIRYPGNIYAGKTYIEDVGFPAEAFQRMRSRYKNWNYSYTYTQEDLRRLPTRPKHSHKGTFGTVLVVAGSADMCGACYFAAKAALKMGAGLVKILTAVDNRQVLNTLLPEAIIFTYDIDAINNNQVRNRIELEIIHADVVIVGPGLGTSDLAFEVLDMVMKHTKCPIIFDADALNLLSKRVSDMTGDSATIEDRIKVLNTILPANSILTPHLKELSGLINCDISKININFIDIVNLCSYNSDSVYIIKDSVTTVAYKQNRYFNQSGNDGLATAGSGDVLTGIIGGLLAQKMELLEAASLGVYLHGLTAERYSEHKGSYSMIANDIIDGIENILL